MKSVLVLCLFMFFACEKGKSGQIVSTETGLKYLDTKMGSGEPAEKLDYVELHYTGWTVSKDSSETSIFADWQNDSTKSDIEFDSSFSRNRPFGFILSADRVIQGWHQGIEGMKVGGKRTLIIPSELGYGVRGSGAKIPPNATLKFQVELVKMDKAKLSVEKVGTGESLKKDDKFLFHYKISSQEDTSQVQIDTYKSSPMQMVYGDEKNHPVYKTLMNDAKVGEKRCLILPGKKPAKIEFEVVKVLEDVPMWDVTGLPVETTTSGLKCILVKKGNGEKVNPEKQLTVHYSGFLENGTMFDSSVQRGEPIKFKVNQVIKGWGEGLQLLNVGSKARLVIPSELGYGKQGSPPVIPPNSNLVFDVEVVDMQ